MEKVDVVIPTFHPGERLLQILELMEMQTVRPRCVRIINTQRDGMDVLLSRNGMTERDLLERFPFLRLEHITAGEFDHGGTRNRGFRSCTGADYVLTMTQDALPRDTKLIEELLLPMRPEDDTDMPGAIAASYARQLPNRDASAEERISRAFNYPEQPLVKSEEDLPRLGVKTYFCSNVCALYRMEIWRRLGGFPDRAIFNEDMLYAAKALKSGYRIRYAAEACVYHSHSYTAMQQLHRNFDLGVSQAQNPQVFAGISSEGEGLTYVRTVMRQLQRERSARQIPGFLWRSGWRLAGYRLGRAYEKLPRAWVLRLTSNRNYWNK